MATKCAVCGADCEPKAGRLALAGARGCPTLTCGQKVCRLLPLWGPIWALLLFWVGQVIRYGRE